MHTVTTSITTNASGAITGYGLSIAAPTTGEPEEIAACITASLDMLRQTIIASFAPASVAAPIATDPPPGYAPAQPPARHCSWHRAARPPRGIQECAHAAAGIPSGSRGSAPAGGCWGWRSTPNRGARGRAAPDRPAPTAAQA
jgi:hypothetical protein